eukprot:4889858-Pyramimonas_sp.AAC.1
MQPLGPHLPARPIRIHSPKQPCRSSPSALRIPQPPASAANPPASAPPLHQSRQPTRPLHPDL